MNAETRSPGFKLLPPRQRLGEGGSLELGIHIFLPLFKNLLDLSWMWNPHL